MLREFKEFAIRYCFSDIAEEATRCPHCTSQLSQPTPALAGA